jgi:hypothetical protein
VIAGKQLALTADGLSTFDGAELPQRYHHPIRELDAENVLITVSTNEKLRDTLNENWSAEIIPMNVARRSEFR